MRGSQGVERSSLYLVHQGLQPPPRVDQGGHHLRTRAQAAWKVDEIKVQVVQLRAVMAAGGAGV